jgi:SAM-dependent methyltransferase
VLHTGLPDAAADTVVCFNSFPHFRQSTALAREAARWLRPEGTMLVWHDIGREQLARIHGDGPPVIRADLLPPVGELATLFRAAGFVVERAEEDEDSYLLLARHPAP